MEKELLQEESQVAMIVLIAILVVLLMGIALVLFFFLSRKKIIQTALEKTNLELSYQKELLHATIQTQEKERKRIAQDLHDAISAKLTVISLTTNVLIDRTPPDFEDANDMLCHILEVTTQTLDSSRTLAHNLLPPILENFGLVAAVEEVCDAFINSQQVAITYKTVYNGYLSKEEELHLFRIIQELLNNSVRHGKATYIALDIMEDQEQLYVAYVDNGKGFDTTNTAVKKGIGLKNIETRVAILQGTFSFYSQLSEGFQCTIYINKQPQHTHEKKLHSISYG